MGENDKRVVLKLKPALDPVKVAAFPLLRNKPELIKAAQEVFDQVKMRWRCEFDDNGNVGKRYRRQDEIGTPYCLTVDFDTLEKGTVTVRDRDTMKQTTVQLNELVSYLSSKLDY